MLALPEKVGTGRNRQANHPLLLGAVAAIVLGLFLTDSFTPAGYSIWVLYIAAVGLSMLGNSPWLPAATAAASVVCILSGAFLSPSVAAEPHLAVINRGSGALVVAILGALGWRFIAVRLLMARRQWLESGRAQIQASMQGDPEVERLSEAVLTEVCRYLDAPVGALHVRDGAGKLRRLATVGVPAGAKAPSLHRVGEGLVGRVAAERRTLRIRDLPPDYLPVTSGVGTTAARELVLVPLVDEQDLVGVLELGFLRSADADELELLSRVSEPIGVEIVAAFARRRLQELLEETQRQAEELQAQQAELEAANAELETHTRALRESQDRLAAQNEELEETTVRLEEKSQAFEQQRDELERAQRELEAKAEELERASRYKSQFLANMSHELRTPLNSALILARLLADNREGTLTPEQIKYAETIYAAGNDLLALINDVLDLARIEAGGLELRIEEVQVASLLSDMRADFEPMARVKGLELRVEGDVDGLAIRTDGRRVEQVLRNLLANALKFTEQGFVRLHAARNGDRLTFAVEDTGIGIAPEAQEIIFEAFRQADGTTSRKYGGTGLGLAISRDLAQRLGGSLRVESEPGKGSTFFFELPLSFEPAVQAAAPKRSEPPALPPVRQVAKQKEPEKEEEALPAPRVPDDREKLGEGARAVLIIEDDLAFARVLQDLAREMHFDTLVATTANEGMDLARRFVPAAVLLDLALPDHNGLSVLDRIKRDPKLRHIPVHVISATDFTSEALSMGAVGYAIKPVKREQLVEAFRRLSEQLGERPRRVLVVEDDPGQSEAICGLLRSAGVETLRASGVAEALDSLQEARFDCMVMDLRLADGTGFELLERMIRQPAASNPPVIVYTGQELTAADEERLRRYSDSIIIKGARSPERLLDEVTLFLHQVEARLPAELQRMLHAARSREASFEGRRILVVEDDVRNVFALSSILEPKGATVTIARDGIEALEALEKNEAIDLVLMDIMMPRMDGFEAIRRIREKPNLAKLPIIALTAKAMADDQARCIEAGANDYAPKPIDVEKLLSLIRVWMPRRERAS